MRAHKGLIGVVLFGGLLALILFVPYESIVVPAASVRVVDMSGRALPDVLVKQEWHDATTEDQQHEDLVKTDENGVASFPVRKVRSTLLKRIVRVIWHVATQGVHANIGSTAAITAYADQDPYVWGWVGYNRNGREWPKQLELKRWDTPARD